MENLKVTQSVVKKSLIGKTFNLDSILINKKDLNDFQDYLAKQSITLVKHLNALKQNYGVVNTSDLLPNFSNQGSLYFFDFDSLNGNVRFIFEKETNSIIHFRDIKVNYYEEGLSLF